MGLELNGFTTTMIYLMISLYPWGELTADGLPCPQGLQNKSHPDTSDKWCINQTHCLYSYNDPWSDYNHQGNSDLKVMLQALLMTDLC